MEIINNFKKKGGQVLWIEGLGQQATYVGEPIKFLMNMETREVYRVTDKEWKSPPEHLTRIRAFFG